MSLSNVSFAAPEPVRLRGRYVTLEGLSKAAHSPALQHALCDKAGSGLWTYIPFGPFERIDEFFSVMEYTKAQLGWVSFSVLMGGVAQGTLSLMRVRQEHGSAEVGAVIFGEALQRTTAATEAIFLLACYVFDQLGYRRFEWKCDERNMASKRAARRFGFQFEGIFRNDMIVNGENRDTVWYAMTDADWRIIKPAYDQWLSPGNFSAGGQQRRPLRSLIDQCLMGTEHSR